MTSKTQIYQHKTALIVSLCLIGGFGHAAKYDMSSEDLFAPSQAEDQFQFDSSTGEQVAPFFEFMPESEQEGLAASYKKIVELIKGNQLDEAQAQTGELLKRFPEQAPTHNLQALIHIQQKNQKAAVASFQQAIKFDPGNLIALQGSAFIALTGNDLKTAADLIDRAIAANANAPLPYILKANIAYRQNRLDEVDTILSTALNKAQGNIQSELLIAENLVKLYEIEQQPAKVLEMTQALLTRHPADKQVLSLLAKAQIVNS